MLLHTSEAPLRPDMEPDVKNQSKDMASHKGLGLKLC